MESFLQILSSESILRPIFFNLLINGLFFFIKEAELANFKDENTIYLLT